MKTLETITVMQSELEEVIRQFFVNAVRRLLKNLNKPSEEILKDTDKLAVLLEIATVLIAIGKKILDEVYDAVGEEGAVGDYLEIVPTYKESSAVDVSKLRKLKPEVYESLAYVEPRAAQRILGKDRIRELCRESCDSPYLKEETVNVTDLKKVLPKMFLDEFLTVKEKFDGLTTNYNTNYKNQLQPLYSEIEKLGGENDDEQKPSE